MAAGEPKATREMPVSDARKDTEDVPNPGSKEAGERGCTCAVMDNRRGRGIPYPRADGKDPNEFPSFYVTGGCPLHDPDNDLARRASQP